MTLLPPMPPAIHQLIGVDVGQPAELRQVGERDGRVVAPLVHFGNLGHQAPVVTPFSGRHAPTDELDLLDGDREACGDDGRRCARCRHATDLVQCLFVKLRHSAPYYLGSSVALSAALACEVPSSDGATSSSG